MVFSSTISVRHKAGSNRVHMGTFTNTAVTTGGNIDTELNTVVGIILTTSGAAVSADQSSVNETLPIAGSAVTIVTTAGADGYWIAWGT
jgi:hypothetical protein